MNAEEANIKRIVALLSSSDTNENIMGATMVVNTSANAHSVAKLLDAKVVKLLIPKLTSNDDELIMKAAWGINNLCVTDEGRMACFQEKVIPHFVKALQRTNPEVIQKACWAITNLARTVPIQKEIVKGQVFANLVHILGFGQSDVEKSYVLQPLCNLVIDPNNQMAFKATNGIPAVIKMFSSRNASAQAQSITLASFMTTHYDVIRDEFVDNGALPPLTAILNSANTVKVHEHALNLILNLSLSAHAEQAIHSSFAVKPVVGFLSSEDGRLVQQAAMALSNMVSNKEIRESIRYYGWVDPLIKLLKSNDRNVIEQVIRIIINITFDEPCRCMLQNAQVIPIVKSATFNTPDKNLATLTATAVKNLGIPVSASVQNDVDHRSGSVERVNPPKIIHQANDVEIDSNAVDNLLKGWGNKK